MDKWEAKDKTLIITGGASGLGAQYAEIFLSQGAKKVAIIDISDVGTATAERLNNVYGGKVVFVKCDVSKEEDIVKTFDNVVADFKRIDVLINNAGVMIDTPREWRMASEVNWLGLVSFTMKAIAHMRIDEGGAGGTIVNVSSVVALTKFHYMPIYSGSKIAVLHFSQCLAADPFYDRTGIRVMVMCLGATDTPLVHRLATCAYDPELGLKLYNTLMEKPAQVQNVESGVVAFVDMMRKGGPGTIWLAIANKPAKDITAMIDKAFKGFDEVVYEGSSPM